MWRGNREPQLVTVMPENPKAITVPRRAVLRAGVLFGTGVIADHIPGSIEQLANSPTTIGTINGEAHVRSESRSISFAQQDVRDSRSIAEALSPSLRRFGPGMYARFSNNGYDTPLLEKALYGEQEKTGMDRLTMFAASDSGNLVAELVPRIYKKIKPDWLIFDCWPQSFDDVQFHGSPVGRGLGLFAGAERYYGPSAIVTGIDDLVVYQNPVYPYFSTNASPPGLSFVQGQYQSDSDRLIGEFAEFVNWHNQREKDKHNGHIIKMMFMRPQTSSTDFLVDDPKAEGELNEKMHGQVIDAPVGGNQGHSNPVQNAEAYNAAIKNTVANYSPAA